MIYLDNAATTFPKPPEVVNAAYECMSKWCGNPGRGSHRLAIRASQALFDCREEASALFGLENSDNVVITSNATYALNAAIFGLVGEGDHVIISDLEHNSVLRPVEFLRQSRGVRYDIFSTRGDPCASVRKLIRPNTRALICTHSSNIVNRRLPAEELGLLCRRSGILFILDASQSAGSVDINMKRDGISALCCAGHKGLLGPQGSGLALFADGILPAPFAYGGSGINSLDIDMPEFLPDRLEAGTMATPAAAGLTEGIKYVRRRGADAIGKYERELCARIHRKLSAHKEIRLYSAEGGALCLFNVRGMTAQECAARLDEAGICVRAGLHCAPLAHKTVGTPEGGAVRASVGPFSTAQEADDFCSVLCGIAKNAGGI